MNTASEASTTFRRRSALLAAALLAVTGLTLASVAGPADAASASVSSAKPDKPPGGGGGGSGGGGNGGGKPGGGGGGTTELVYTAVGDSFAAGTGAGSYVDTSSCYRSSKSYPRLLDSDANLRLDGFLACSGASTETVRTSQVPAIPTSAARVTLTVGGNDVGFADVMFYCFVIDFGCESRIINAETLVANGTVAANIATTVQAITSRASGAKVVVTGYPLLFNEPSGYRWAARVNQGTIQLNAAIKSAAEANGAVFVDVVPVFTGHGLGSANSWITPGGATVESFHPNASGQAAYAAEIRKVIG